MPCKQLDILLIYQTHFFAKLHKQIKDWLRLKKILLRDWKAKRLNCNDSSFKALGTFGNLSFGMLCKCISMSEPGCWKSSSSELLIWFEESNNQNVELNWEPTNDQTTNEVQPSSTFITSYMFEKVNGINTAYRFEAVNGVNAKPFEAFNELICNHDKNRVNIWVAFSDKQDDEIQSKSLVECNSWPKRSLTCTCPVLFPSFCAIGT